MRGKVEGARHVWSGGEETGICLAWFRTHDLPVTQAYQVCPQPAPNFGSSTARTAALQTSGGPPPPGAVAAGPCGHGARRKPGSRAGWGGLRVHCCSPLVKPHQWWQSLAQLGLPETSLPRFALRQGLSARCAHCNISGEGRLALGRGRALSAPGRTRRSSKHPAKPGRFLLQ